MLHRTIVLYIFIRHFHLHHSNLCVCVFVCSLKNSTTGTEKKEKSNVKRNDSNPKTRRNEWKRNGKKKLTANICPLSAIYVCGGCVLSMHDIFHINKYSKNNKNCAYLHRQSAKDLCIYYIRPFHAHKLSQFNEESAVRLWLRIYFLSMLGWLWIYTYLDIIIYWFGYLHCSIGCFTEF